MIACETCILGLGKRCAGRRHARYCQLVDPNHKDYDPWYVDAVRRESAKAPDPPYHEVHPERTAAPPTPRPIIANMRIWKGKHIELVLAETCPYRGDQISGGCNCTWKCWAGRADSRLDPTHAVWRDCLMCVREANLLPVATAEPIG
jgi:hypothetical protein